MKYIATATLKDVITASATVKNKIVVGAIINTNNPVASTAIQYNLIDGGAPDTVYVPIEGFNLIDGGTP